MENIVKQWIERSNYDLSSARALLNARKYLYAAFLCQQAVEKAIKALLAGQNKEIPLIHNLRKLAEIADIGKELSMDQIDFLERLTPFAIKARYGSYKRRMSEICNRKTAVEFIQLTEGFLKWLRKKI